MQIKISNPFLVLTALLFLSLAFSSCGSKKQSDNTIPQAETKTPESDCDVWKKNQTFLSASYSLGEKKDGVMYINKLSIQQLITSLQVESDPDLAKLRRDLLDIFDRTPSDDAHGNSIEFTNAAITLRDQLALGVQSHIDKCAH